MISTLPQKGSISSSLNAQGDSWPFLPPAKRKQDNQWLQDNLLHWGHPPSLLPESEARLLRKNTLDMEEKYSRSHWLMHLVAAWTAPSWQSCFARPTSADSRLRREHLFCPKCAHSGLLFTAPCVTPRFRGHCNESQIVTDLNSFIKVK